MGAGGPVNDASSPLLKVIWGRTLDAKASRSCTVSDGAMTVLWSFYRFSNSIFDNRTLLMTAESEYFRRDLI